MDAQLGQQTNLNTSSQQAQSLFDDPKAVYVKKMRVAELKKEPELAGKLDALDPLSVLYSVHLGDGRRVALMEDHAAAFAGARQYEMQPHSVH